MNGGTDERLERSFATVPLSRLVDSRSNPRTLSAAGELAELSASIAVQGIVVPLLVRPTKSGELEVVCGQRRLAAARELARSADARMAGKVEQIPVEIRELTDDEAVEIQLVENLQRADIHFLDEALTYRTLIGKGYDVEGVAVKVGKSVAYVTRRLKLNDLTPKAVELCRQAILGLAHCEILARLADLVQCEVLKRCTSRMGKKVKAESPRDFAAFVSNNIFIDLAAAVFDKAESGLGPAPGSCLDCAKRSGSAPLLFADLKKSDVCTDPACYRAKVNAHIQRAVKAARDAGKPLLEISGQYGYGKQDPEKPLDHRYYLEAGPDSCEHVRSAIVVDQEQYGLEIRGKIMTVCAEQSCKIHRPGYSAEDPQQRKQRLEEKKKAAVTRQVRRAQLEALCAKVRKLTDGDLRAVARAWLHGLWHEFMVALASQLGKQKDDKSHPFEFIKARLSKMSQPDVCRLLLRLAFIRVVDSPANVDPELVKDFGERLEATGVDAKKVAWEVRARLEKKPVKAEKSKKGKAVAGARRAQSLNLAKGKRGAGAAK